MNEITKEFLEDYPTWIYIGSLLLTLGEERESPKLDFVVNEARTHYTAFEDGMEGYLMLINTSPNREWIKQKLSELDKASEMYPATKEFLYNNPECHYAGRYAGLDYILDSLGMLFSSVGMSDVTRASNPIWDRIHHSHHSEAIRNFLQQAAEKLGLDNPEKSVKKESQLNFPRHALENFLAANPDWFCAELSEPHHGDYQLRLLINKDFSRFRVHGSENFTETLHREVSIGWESKRELLYFHASFEYCESNVILSAIRNKLNEEFRKRTTPKSCLQKITGVRSPVVVQCGEWADDAENI